MDSTSSEPASNTGVLGAARAVDAEAEQFRLFQRATVLAILFNRRRNRGGIPDRQDVSDYEAITAIVERGQ